MAKEQKKTKKNRCIVCNIRPTKDEVKQFKTESLQIDPFWNDLLNNKEWKRRKK